MLPHHRQQLRTGLVTELPPQKTAEMGAGALPADRLHAPCHVHKEFCLILARLDVAHVQYPYLPDAAVVGRRHLLVEQGGRECAQPQVVVRTAPIAHVIVDAVAALAPPFGLGREVTDVAIVVVAPHQAHIFGHLQTGIIHIKHLFIGDEDLWDFRHISVHIPAQQLPLVGKHPF